MWPSSFFFLQKVVPGAAAAPACRAAVNHLRGQHANKRGVSHKLITDWVFKVWRLPPGVKIKSILITKEDLKP